MKAVVKHYEGRFICCSPTGPNRAVHTNEMRIKGPLLLCHYSKYTVIEVEFKLLFL